MRVLMIPSWLNVQGHEESGIKAVIAAYAKHFPEAGIELVDPKAASFDVLAVHAGMTNTYPIDAPMVAHLHGLYWSGDYQAATWEHKVNRSVVDGLRHSTSITVPSAWVAETFQRDMHRSPYVVPHGIDWQEWEHSEPNEGYILGYTKNRAGSDVCNPVAMGELAKRRPDLQFVGTFAPPGAPSNVRATGLVQHAEMKRMVQRCAVLVSSVKETFGVLHLEAMAAGIPILGFRQGGILDTVKHGINGYLAEPGNEEDLLEGLAYCLEHRATLGANGKEMVKRFDWQSVARQLHGIYQETVDRFHQAPEVSVVIPCYNLAGTLRRAVQSVMDQSRPVKEIVIVDNNSADNTLEISRQLMGDYPVVRYVNESEQGVAHARNRGVRESTAPYIVCLDADDVIAPGFVEACIKPMLVDRSLGVTYTRLRWVKPDGSTGVSPWPGPYDYDKFLAKQNQVPTCAMFRREVWSQLGGYRQRYAPKGAGAEDAEFFLRAGAMGWGAQLASEEALFVYSWGSGRVSGDPHYQEPDWLHGKPWVYDKAHPFASLASPANKWSHLVRQYDRPIVSVVIPCSPEHKRYLVDAIDSLEAQTFRQWEAIVVCDGFSVTEDMHAAFPFVRWVECTKRGAGAARNLGAERARARYLLFLDADDWLRPKALERLLDAWDQNQAIAYSDYVGHATIQDKNEVANLRARQRLESYDEKTGAAKVIHYAFEYSCEEALQQPKLTRNGEFFIWNIISSLLPARWHQEIGGFDESMPSWEDWDYWIRLARAGKCFVRVPEVLIDYRIETGTRRETGRQIHQTLLDYLTRKYQEKPPMPCGSCGGRRSTTAQAAPVQLSPQLPAQISANTVVWVQLIDENLGEHNIGRGAVTRTDYGYHKHGDIFKMDIRDAQIKPRLFRVLPNPEPAPLEDVKQETPAPVAIG